MSTSWSHIARAGVSSGGISTRHRYRLPLIAAGLGLLAGPAMATDLLYTPMSPNFGGTNPIAFQMAQYAAALKAQNAANAAAAAKAATPSDPNAAFTNAIISQLTGLVARNIAQKIASSTDGQAGTIQSGDVTVTFVNSDGQLNVGIITPAGTTNLSVPSGS